MMPRAIRTLLGLVLTTQLLGCGFTLRGQSQLPPEMARTHVTAPAGSRELVNELTGLLRGNGIDVVAADAASAGLRITRNELARNVQSIGATARVREFVLVYQLEFDLVDDQGNILLPSQLLELERDYTFDQGQVLGAASEEEYLRQEMTRDMARRILESIELAVR